MGRHTIYNQITSEEKIASINKKNKLLMNDFLDYLVSIDRAPLTIKNYRSDLTIFFCWCVDFLDNKYFVDLTKRDITRFQSYALTEWKWSSNRMRAVKAVLSSLSNYIEDILDDEIADYKPIVRKIKNPAKQVVREKSIFENDELAALLNRLVEAKQYQKACVLAAAVYSGRRKSELCRFKVDYFKDENIIYGSLYKTPEKVKTKGHGRQGKMLRLYVLVKDFKKYFDLWMEERARLGIDSEWLFVTKTETGSWEQIKISTLDSWAATFTSMCNKPFYWHSLRHFFVTQLQRSGIPDSAVQQIIGWDSADMVTVYSDIETDETLGAYFDEDGIKAKKPTSLSEI